MLNKFEKVYVTGDTHGDFRKVQEFFNRVDNPGDCALIILGDVGCTYYIDKRSKLYFANLSYALNGAACICIRGNHEKDPAKLPEMFHEEEMFGGKVFVTNEFPNIVYLQDGGEYTINDMKFLAIGGAYSVDKFYRLSKGLNWYDDEQIDDAVKARVKELVPNSQYDFVITHTCPLSAEPVEDFLSFIDQSTVDKTMEIFFEDVLSECNFGYWLAGHYHTDKYKLDGKLRLMFREFIDITGNKIEETY